MRTIDESTPNEAISAARNGTDSTPTPLRPRRFRDWPSIAMVLALFVVALTAVLWLVDRTTYSAKHAELVSHVESLGRSTRQRLHANEDYLRMLAAERGGLPPDSELFQKRASRYVTDHAELINILWLDPGLCVQGVAPIEPNKALLGIHLNSPEPQQAARLAMETRQPVYTRAFEAVHGHPSFDLLVPVFDSLKFLGWLAAAYSCEGTLRTLVPNQVIKDNHVSLLDSAGQPICELPFSGSLDERLEHKVAMTPPPSNLILHITARGLGFVGWELRLMGFLSLMLLFVMGFAMWKLKREVEVRKQAEHEAREAHEYMHHVISAANVLILGLDAQGRVRMFNKAAERITGYSREELEGVDWFSKIVPRDRFAATWEAFRDFQKGSSLMPANFESPILTKDGQERIISWQNTTTLSPDRAISTISFGIDVTNRRHAEDALRKSESELRDAQRVGRIGSWEWNAITDTVTWSREYFHLHGADDSAPAPGFEERLKYYTPESAARLNAAVRKTLETGEPYEIDLELVSPNSPCRWLTARSEAKRDGHGNIVGLYGTAQDITQRREAEETLRQTHQLLESIFEHTHTMVAYMDAKFNFIRVNRAYALSDDHVPSFYVGKNHFDLFPNAENEAIFNKVVNTGNPHFEFARPFEYAEHLERGTSYWDWSLVPIKDAHGAVTAVILTLLNVTDRLWAEHALRDSEAKMRSIVNNVGVGVALISPKLEVLEMNHRMREWFPNVDTSLRPTCFREFSDPAREQACEYCPTIKTLDDGQVHEAMTLTPRTNGSRNYRIIASPILDEHGIVTAAIELVEDITDRVSLEAQLRHSQKMESIGRLAGGVAHDFNNMLGAIIGHSELAMERHAPSDPTYSDLEQIRAAAERSADLTRQLLAFARRQIITPRVLEPNTTVEGLLKMLRRLIGENIELTWLPGTGVWPIKIDPSQVDQLLANLCVNARDAIAGVGRITIATQNVTVDEDYCGDNPDFVPGEYVLLVVSDDGCGMDQDTLSKIFEPFFTTKGIGKGTGLGLSTVYGIVKQNKGLIHVYSELGKGTIFRIYLPRHLAAEEQLGKEQRPQPPTGGTETILLVEDESTILNLARRILERFGYHVLAAATPSEALRIASEQNGMIHLMITDVIMPEMNGRDLVNKLTPLFPTMKTLYMSGYTADVIAHQDALDEGVHFIQKPFTVQTLAVKVRDVLDGQ